MCLDIENQQTILLTWYLIHLIVMVYNIHPYKRKTYPLRYWASMTNNQWCESYGSKKSNKVGKKLTYCFRNVDNDGYYFLD